MLLPKRKSIQFIGLVCLLLLISLSTFAQTTTVRGTVLKASDSSPISDVTVSEQGTNTATKTDKNGTFTLNVSSNKAVLVFSNVGFQPYTLSWDGSPSVKISLKQDVSSLEDVIVIGYGAQKKANLTGSVASVNMDDIQGVPISNVATALQGRLPGVTISAFNSQPGKNNPNIRIRGIGTLGDNNPLVVIDGVPSGTDELGDLSSDDIESISVLKDAASASIYGVRAGNGVILVTTKRGKAGKPVIQVRSTFTRQTPLIKPDYMDAITWATAYNDFLSETGAAAAFTPEQLQKIRDQSDPDNFANTDWFDEVYKPALFHNQYVSASGGSEATKYLVSAEYQNQEGVAVNTGSKRLQLRANIDNKISNAVSFGLNLRGYKQSIQEPIAAADGNDAGDNGINRVISGFTRPTVPARYKDGNYGTSDGTTLPVVKNPLRSLYEQEYNTDDYRLDGKVFGEVKFLKNFSFLSSIAFVYSNTREQRFNPALPSFGPGGVQTFAPGINNLFISNAISTSYVNENLLKYGKRFGRHDLKVLIGQTVQHDEYKFASASVSNLPNNSIRVLGASSETPNNNGSASALSLQSFLGRVNYIFDKKYLFEVNARIDGSSRLPASQQYPLFPSFSAGWLVSEEAFLRNSKVISLLKLRGSYGILGNQNIGNYAFTQNYNLSQNYVFNNLVVQGVAITGLANDKIKWETTAITDFGVDMELFKGKLGIVADYFNKNTSDILYRIPIPNTLGGLTAPFQNVARVNNKGFELALTYSNSIGKFRYNVGVNGSSIRNEVVDLAGDLDVISGTSILTPGRAINSYYGYIADGIIRTQEDLAKAPAGFGTIPLRIGDISYRDLNNDGKITAEDRTIIGNPFPKLSYGFNLSADYMGFDLSIFMQGVSGLNRYFTDPANMMPRAQKLNVWNDRFTPDNTDGDLPRYGNAPNNNLFSTYGAAGSYGFFKGDYLRLKNLEVGYSLPSQLISKLRMNSVRVYFSGVNLYTFTKVKDYDVEKQEDDGRSLGYLNTKNYAFGLSIKL